MDNEKKDVARNKIEVMRLIEFLQDEIDAAGKVPFSNKVMVDQKMITQLIDDISEHLPEDFSTAQYVISEKDRILDEANSEYNKIKQEAQDIMRTQVNEHAIVREAEQRAREIISKAQNESKNMRLAAREYADGLLSDLESELSRKSQESMMNFKKNMEDFVTGFSDSVRSTSETVRNNIEELRDMEK